MNPTIAIIDYGMGNLRSVQKALARVGADAHSISEPRGAAAADGLVLPGVGAFAQAMEHLSQAGFDGLVREWVQARRPFLGICLGLQLLFGESEEFGPAAGLNIIPGRVIRFRGPAFEPRGDQPPPKVPHIGWNALKVVTPHPVLEGVGEGAMAYFVHSYYCLPDDPEWTAVVTQHGIEFTSAVARGSLFASQFHPEKSGDIGLKMLENFVRLCAERDR